jgi:hypothetical protein
VRDRTWYWACAIKHGNVALMLEVSRCLMRLDACGMWFPSVRMWAMWAMWAQLMWTWCLWHMGSCHEVVPHVESMHVGVVLATHGSHMDVAHVGRAGKPPVDVHKSADLVGSLCFFPPNYLHVYTCLCRQIPAGGFSFRFHRSCHHFQNIMGLMS